MDVSWLKAGASEDSSSGKICLARTLPSSTPHWSKELISQITPLGKDLVLIESDELTEDVRGQLLGHEGIGGPVALKHLVGDQRLVHAFRPDLLLGLAEGQGLGLGKEVGHEFGVVIAQRVVALAKADEVAGDQLGALVDELVEGVLPVGAGLAPDDRSGLPRRPGRRWW